MGCGNSSTAAPPTPMRVSKDDRFQNVAEVCIDGPMSSPSAASSTRSCKSSKHTLSTMNSSNRNFSSSDSDGWAAVAEDPAVRRVSLVLHSPQATLRDGLAPQQSSLFPLFSPIPMDPTVDQGGSSGAPVKNPLSSQRRSTAAAENQDTLSYSLSENTWEEYKLMETERESGFESEWNRKQSELAGSVGEALRNGSTKNVRRLFSGSLNGRMTRENPLSDDTVETCTSFWRPQPPVSALHRKDSDLSDSSDELIHLVGVEHVYATEAEAG